MLEVDSVAEERFVPENPFVTEMDYFASCIEKKVEPDPGGENSLKNLRLMEEVFEKASVLPVS
jgi:hypothetical protein